MKRIFKKSLVFLLTSALLFSAVNMCFTVGATGPSLTLTNGNFETAGTDANPVPGFTVYDYYKKNSASIVDGTSVGRSSNVLSMNYTNASGSTDAFAIAQSVPVEANTDYVWTFYMDCASGANHHIGVVAGSSLEFFSQNVTLPIFVKADSNVTIADNTSTGPYVCIRDGWKPDTNWKEFSAFNKWVKITVSFNSGSNTTVSLAYSSHYSGRTAYLDDWSINKIPYVENPGFENGTTGYMSINNNAAFESIADTDHENNQVLHFAGNTTRGSGSIYQDVPVLENTEYVWTFDMKQGENTKNDAVYPTVTTTAWANLNITESTDNGTLTNYNHGLKSDNKWNTFSIRFNSGENSVVRLTLNAWASTNNVYLDNFAVEKYVAPPETIENFTNHGFENGLQGYQTTPKFSGEIVTDVVHSGNKALKVAATGAWYNAYLYQNVSVLPNKNYEWSFWFNCDVTSTDKAFSAGVRTSDGENLLPSSVSSDGGYLIDAMKSFNTLRPASTLDNWHKGFTTNGWKKYTVAFNSGNFTKVSLTIDAVYDNRLGYTDDWCLTATDQSTVLNGNFEGGLVGYNLDGEMTADAITDNNSTVAKLSGGETAFASSFSQEIIVDAYTEYIWSFDLKTVSGGNAMFGVRNGENSDSLLMSKMVSGGTPSVSNPCFFSARSTGSTNWHQSIASNGYTTYTLHFYTGANTSALLTINPVNNTRTLYTDNWSVVKRDIHHGDANADGTFTASDMVALKKILLQLSLSDFAFSGLDANRDGAVNIRDLVNLKKGFSNITLTDTDDSQIMLDGYRLVWADDFSENSIDENNWNFAALMSEKSDLKLYSDSRAVDIGNGSVTLKSDYDATNEVYTSNLSMTTKNNMSFKYGYIEMRAKLPFGAPCFPSFWMQSTKSSTDTMGEIDILEHFGTDDPYIQTGIHKWYADGGHDCNNASGKIGQYQFETPEIAEGWHTYGLLWTETTLKFFVDGVAYHTIDITDNFGTGDMSCFNDYAYIIMNNYLYTEASATEEEQDKAAIPEDFTAGSRNYEIDYVHLYQLANIGGLICK